MWDEGITVHKGCYEFEGKLYYDPKKRDAALQVKKQQLNDVVYEDLNDIVFSIVSRSQTKTNLCGRVGQRTLFSAIALAMLEDSENPENGLTKESEHGSEMECA